jgi:adenylylsulfate kinase-like enzyme
MLYGYLKAKNSTTVFLDGDTLREVFGGDLGYTPEERRACAMRYSRLCKLLSGQGMTVVCCTISMFDTVREWNRENISGYVEVYIQVSIETLARRNQKGLYSDSTENVYGVDLYAELPKNPDLIIQNDGALSPEECLEIIIEQIL